MNTEIIKVPLKNKQDVKDAYEEASFLAAHIGFDKLACAQIALAVSEICNNAVTHGGGGEALIRVLNKQRIIRIEITDKGMGIPNIERAMADGFSTSRSSLGIGMEVAKRSMDRMDIVSESNKGTAVILEKYLPLPNTVISKGVVSVPDDRYEDNGDAFFYKEFNGDKIVIGVIDGLGQGFKARLFSQSIKGFLVKNYRLPVDEMIVKCNELLCSHNFDFGAAVGIALIDTNTRVVEMCGIGDVVVHFYSNEILRTYTFPDGQMCTQPLPYLPIQRFILPSQSTISICSDGIKSNIISELLTWDNSAQWLANNIFNLFHKPYGDATVFVAKIDITNV